jgi:hypothetical protein
LLVVSALLALQLHPSLPVLGSAAGTAAAMFMDVFVGAILLGGRLQPAVRGFAVLRAVVGTVAFAPPLFTHGQMAGGVAIVLQGSGLVVLLLGDPPRLRIVVGVCCAIPALAITAVVALFP